MDPLRPAALALLSALALATPALAAPGPSAWTLSSADGARQCRLTLRPPAGAARPAVAMPVGCHRAFPALGGVASWSRPDGAVDLDDAQGRTLLSFAAGGDGFRGTTPQGEALRLEPAERGARAALDAAAAALPERAEVAQAGARAPAAARKPAAPAPKAAEVAGRYAVLRDKTRDTGCMVTLDGRERGPGNTLKAHLAPACRDQGIVIFDPVGWQMVGGRLVLTARKGHTTELDAQEDGSWMNSPKTGKALSLKRI